jgi:hypothetical protein
MFLMKFCSNQQKVTSEPMFSSYVDLVDFHAHETPEIEVKDYATIPILDQTASIHDETELPEWYSPSIGPLDKVTAKTHRYSYFYEQQLFKGTSTREVIIKAKKLSDDIIKSERSAIDQHLTKQETQFFTSMQTLSSGMNEAIEVKKQAIYAALSIYFYNAYTSLQHAKSNMQEKILKAHKDMHGNEPLTAFEYSIMCCLSKIDFVFDKSITNLSSKQYAYMQALANDDVSGEDTDLFNEIPNYFERYTTIIQTIGDQVIELISMHDEKNYNELPLADKLRETIQQFKVLNADEKINKPIYTVAEIAMQAYCTSLVKNTKIREYFINDGGFNLNCSHSMDLLNNWICNPEFIDPQSKLRHEIWGILFKEIIDDFDIVSSVKRSLHKAAKDLVLQNNLSSIILADTRLQAQQASNKLFASHAGTNPTETKKTTYCGFRPGFLS